MVWVFCVYFASLDVRFFLLIWFDPVDFLAVEKALCLFLCGACCLCLLVSNSFHFIVPIVLFEVVHFSPRGG